MSPLKRITVLLVDDHTLLRQAMRTLLLTESGFEIVGEAADGKEAVELAAQLQPAVVVMDIAMPKLDGLEATRQIGRRAPQSKVLILSSYSDDKFVQGLVEAGAVGYLLKHSAAEDFIAAVREAAAGKSRFSPTIAKQLFEHYRHSAGREEEPPAAGLTR